ncbi:uncharacterized protein LOC110857906 [Folsomia candida]|uniref:Protein quiver n=1 Tax=Folsomia candida TaxID=158441 RepID=A0A226DFV4_FOLCA|nr:uncharacterized protein LOC110857906 [Folsomia candida]OXA44422.1 hypothetical protein Fcan01_20744 [Folsomia candida]
MKLLAGILFVAFVTDQSTGLKCYTCEKGVLTNGTMLNWTDFGNCDDFHKVSDAERKRSFSVDCPPESKGCWQSVSEGLPFSGGKLNTELYSCHHSGLHDNQREELIFGQCVNLKRNGIDSVKACLCRGDYCLVKSGIHLQLKNSKKDKVHELNKK